MCAIQISFTRLAVIIQYLILEVLHGLHGHIGMATLGHEPEPTEVLLMNFNPENLAPKNLDDIHFLWCP